MIKNYKEFRDMTSMEIAKKLEASPDSWYNYVTALRGPDIDDNNEWSQSLKKLFTCFLRGHTHLTFDIMDFENFIQTSISKGNPFKEFNFKDYPHFLLHIHYALRGLRKFAEPSSDLKICIDILLNLIDSLDNDDFLDTSLKRLYSIITKSDYRRD